MLRYSAEALGDVERLHSRLIERDAGVADRFLAHLRQTEQKIASRPLLYPRAQNAEDARKCLMRFGRSVYVIYDCIDGDDQVIVRIWHGREIRV